MSKGNDIRFFFGPFSRDDRRPLPFGLAVVAVNTNVMCRLMAPGYILHVFFRFSQPYVRKIIVSTNVAKATLDKNVVGHADYNAVTLSVRLAPHAFFFRRKRGVGTESRKSF